MAWTNYRNIVERFDHIDAEFVRAAGLLSSDGLTAELVVRFYPWWEHPQYVKAIERGEPWGFSSDEAGKRDVIVRAINAWACRLSPRKTVVDWGFAEVHPLLWSFAEQSTVYVNAPFAREALFDGLMALALPNVSEDDLRNHIQLRDPSKAPMGLTMPAQLHEPVATVRSAWRSGIQSGVTECAAPRGRLADRRRRLHRC
jgi:hypothetical protein